MRRLDRRAAGREEERGAEDGRAGAYGVIRQLIDEVADIEEDVRSGLLTLPAVFRLDGALLSVIERIWAGDAQALVSLPECKQIHDGIDYALGTVETWQRFMDLEFSRIVHAYLRKGLGAFSRFTGGAGEASATGPSSASFCKLLAPAATRHY